MYLVCQNFQFSVILTFEVLNGDIFEQERKFDILIVNNSATSNKLIMYHDLYDNLLFQNKPDDICTQLAKSIVICYY